MTKPESIVNRLDAAIKRNGSDISRLIRDVDHLVDKFGERSTLSAFAECAAVAYVRLEYFRLAALERSRDLVGPTTSSILSPQEAEAVADECEREDRIDALPYPDDAPVADVLAYVLSCARLWQPEARIIGNARAGDIVRALSHPPAPAVTKAMVEASLRHWFDGEVTWDRGMTPAFREKMFASMRAALQAAQEVKP